MAKNKKVVITGIAPITANGIGKDELWNNLLEKKYVVKKIPERFEKTYRFKSKHYVPFPEISLQDYGYNVKYNGLMEEPSKLAVIGAKMALIDSGFEIKDNKLLKPAEFSNASVILGIGMSSLKSAFNSFANHIIGKNADILEEIGIATGFNRMIIPSVMPNAASSWISILFGINGPNYTINTACSSGAYAIGEAFQKIRDGYFDIIITGGVECLKDDTGTIMRGFDVLGTLTKSDDGRPMPFSNKRSGFLFSEGSGCILILEEYEKAIKRGANIYAEIIGFEANSDAYNIVQMESSGKQVKKLIKKILANIKPDYINTHGTGTILNDMIEYKIIREIFGDKKNQPLTNSTKGNLGHSIGSSGAVEIAVTALSVKNSKVHANLADDMFDNMNLAHETIDMDINYALSLSYGFGGHNSAILLKKIVTI
ncbi:MAG: beta-ketoacyl-[acyl-carrier-protein] synthase family protein [Bacteroidia bacterium]|nr:beta-ketoacyl-[acyl-carrier-protein] synthase family protein [Bacteroidia bacterium]